MNRNDLTSMMPHLMEMDPDAVCAPTAPTHEYIQDAENLYAWMRSDVHLLCGAGLCNDMVETFQARIGALREAQSAWAARRNSRDQTQLDYDRLSALAFDNLDSSLHHMRFAFRRHPDLLGRLPRLEPRTPHSRKIQMMNDLAVIGREVPALLEVCGFSLENLDTLAVQSDQLANLRATSIESQQRGNGAKLLRDRAFSYLKIVVDETRETARFLFRKNPERLAGYRTAINRKSRSAVVAEPSVEAPESTMEETVSPSMEASAEHETTQAA